MPSIISCYISAADDFGEAWITSVRVINDINISSVKYFEQDQEGSPEGCDYED